VTFHLPSQAEAAVSALDGFLFSGSPRPIKVKISESTGGPAGNAPPMAMKRTFLGGAVLNSLGQQADTASLNLAANGNNEATKLFVGKLPFSKNELEISKVFSKFGPVAEVCLHRDAQGQKKGGAFVQYYDEDAATAALEMDGYLFEGATRPITVSIAGQNQGTTQPAWKKQNMGFQGYQGNMGFGGNYGSNNVQTNMNCQTTDWSDWSPCSKRCGTGHKRRTKLFIVPFVPNRSCDVRLYDKQDCYGNDRSCETYGQMQNSYPEVDNYERSANGVVQTLGQNAIYNLPPEYDETNVDDTQDICSAEMDPGSCHGHTERWYFDSQTGTCRSFSYTGCRGNRNNFAGKQQCENACMDSSNQNLQNNNRPQYWINTNHHDTSFTPENNFNQFQTLNLELEQPEEEIPMRPQVPLSMDAEIDCSVSAWSTWSACTKSCGNGGWQTRHREVLINPSTYGKSCPRKMMRRRKCRQMPCPADTTYWYQGSWRHMVDPDDE